MTNISARLFEAFRYLRTDAVMTPPRQETREPPRDATKDPVSDENVDTSHEEDEPEIEMDDLNKDENPKSNAKKKDNGLPSPPKSVRQMRGNINTVTGQAHGNVTNIVDCNNSHIGNVVINYFGPTTSQRPNPEPHKKPEEKTIKKCNLIRLLMEATIKPEHEHIDYVSKNLGRNWHEVFIKLGYKKGTIETFEIDHTRNGVAQARYKLFLDWIQNEDDATLGRLAAVLWEEGERQVVKELALIYSVKKL